MNLVASTFTNGAFASFASRRAISVLPQPVGPIMRMFFGRDFLAQRIFDLHAAPAIAQRDGHRALGGALADDVLVELRRRFRGGSCEVLLAAPRS